MKIRMLIFLCCICVPIYSSAADKEFSFKGTTLGSSEKTFRAKNKEFECRTADDAKGVRICSSRLSTYAGKRYDGVSFPFW